jgi:hypothetical protein
MDISCVKSLRAINRCSAKLSDEPCFTQQTGGLTWGITLREMQHAQLNRDRLSREFIGQSRARSYGNPRNLPGEHCVQHATVQFRSDAAATPIR